jgi:hypothetical protein
LGRSPSGSWHRTSPRRGCKRTDQPGCEHLGTERNQR